MSGKEIFRKVPSVCGYLSARDAEKVGLITVGMQLVLLKPNEMYYCMETLPYNYEKGCVVEVKELDGDGIPYCYFPSQDTSSCLSLKRLAYPSVYEAVYKDVQQPEKEEVGMKEDQYEWIVENPDKKPTKDLSARELKALYDAMNVRDSLVTVEILGKVEDAWFVVGGHDPGWTYAYRVKRKVVDTPLDIPWEFVDKKYKYAAMDENGSVWFTDKEPYIESSTDTSWTSKGVYVEKSILTHDTSGINWKRSLTKRPS